MKIIMKEVKELKGKSEKIFSNLDWKNSATCHNCDNKGHSKKECSSKKSLLEESFRTKGKTDHRR